MTSWGRDRCWYVPGAQVNVSASGQKALGHIPLLPSTCRLSLLAAANLLVWHRKYGWLERFGGFLKQVGIGLVLGHKGELIGTLWERLAAFISGKVCGPGSLNVRTSSPYFNLEGRYPIAVAAVLEQSFDVSCWLGLHCAPGLPKCWVLFRRVPT